MYCTKLYSSILKCAILYYKIIGAENDTPFNTNNNVCKVCNCVSNISIWNPSQGTLSPSWMGRSWENIKVEIRENILEQHNFLSRTS